jgi:hypothetical protein
MPTPFNHLLAACEIEAVADWPPALREILRAEWPAFLLGNIAPDVQTLSGQPREATHFFRVPLDSDTPAYTMMFAAHPALARARALPAAHAAFLAGYLAHLQFDQLWIAEIFAPVFGLEAQWGDFRKRLYLHNALRAHWDAHDLEQLPADIGAQLHTARPARWLPFVRDEHLAAWRDAVGNQLIPGGAARTVEVFAERMRVDPQVFAALVNSPEAMRAKVFSRISPQQLFAYRARAMSESAQLIRAFWDEALV